MPMLNRYYEKQYKMSRRNLCMQLNIRTNMCTYSYHNDIYLKIYRFKDNTYYLIVGDWAFRLYFWDLYNTHNIEPMDNADVYNNDGCVVRLGLCDDVRYSLHFYPRGYVESSIVLHNIKVTDKGMSFRLLTLNRRYVKEGLFGWRLFLNNSYKCKIDKDGVLHLPFLKKIQGENVASLMRGMVFEGSALVYDW